MSACCETPAFKPPASPPPVNPQDRVLIGPPNSGNPHFSNRLTGRQKATSRRHRRAAHGPHGRRGRDDLNLIDLPASTP